MTASRAESVVVGHDSAPKCRTATDSPHIEVRLISAEQHLGFIARHGGASFLQTPAWARVKSEWRGESIGFFDADTMTGAGLLLYRRLWRLKRYLAYLPEGPVLDWSRADVAEHLAALVGYARRNRAFAVRIGPPVVEHRWGLGTIGTAIADGRVRLDEMPADEVTVLGAVLRRSLTDGGWLADDAQHGVAAGQPVIHFRLGLRRPDGAQKSEAELLAAMSQQWRRNIAKADRRGVVVRLGGWTELCAFHEIYLETAERNGFVARPLSYFERMWDVLGTEAPDRMRLYLAEHDGDLVAATTMVRVGGQAWYGYGASTTANRDVRGSNAIQWRMIRDANAAGAAVYDLRGINGGTDKGGSGLLRFKAGTGGEAVGYLGEWDHPIDRRLYALFQRYLTCRRAARPQTR